MKYIIITPVKNEEDYIELTLNSVVAQTLRPIEWIILNDNSTDNTGKIVEGFACRNKWIKQIYVTDNTIVEYSSRVVYLFRLGVDLITEEHNYLAKIDGDVSFDRDFCKNIILTFENDPILGIASGHLTTGGIKEKMIFGDNTRGATKFYRKKCFEDIGGLYLSRGWDQMDDVAARWKGWKTRTLSYGFNHHKVEGIKSGHFKRHYDTGKFNGRVPYHPLYLFLKLLRVFFVKPIFIAPFIQLAGYFESRFISKERPFPKEVSDYWRKEQMQKIKETIFLKTKSL